MAKFAPYGAWTSPISAEMVMRGAVRIDQLAVSDAAVWWSEGRPTEGGRTQIVRRSSDGSVSDVLPEMMSARSMVHEYGGGAWWLAGETVVFANAADQRLWRLDPGFPPTALTLEPARPRGLRYADGAMTPDLRWIVCVQEAHPGERGVDPAATEAVNRLVAIPATGGTPVVLRDGADFVMSPALDERGELLAWIEWNHPDMPWDRSELWVARLDRVGDRPILAGATRVAGGGDESVMAPRWDRDGRLWFISDRTDWWNLFHFPGSGPPSGEPVAVAPGPFEVGLPPWVFGESRYDVLADGRVVFAYSTDGLDRLAVYEPMTGRLDHLSVPVTSIHQVRAGDSQVTFLGASFTRDTVVHSTLVGRGGAHSPLANLSTLGEPTLTSAVIAEGQPITFPTDGGKIAHGLYYAPTNAAFVATDGSRPPLIVSIHGGPTAAAGAQLNLRTQFWTSRGFALVDVNYRGSTGYGRRYRDELRGQWGVADVEDCRAAARFLAESGRADPERLLIRGGSAGGFTVLQALLADDSFRAGCSLYGIADLEALVGDDHKFESRYTESLVAPYPEGRAVWRERSPIHRIDELRRPLILFQGLDDTVVPPSQSQMVADALERSGVPYAYIAFPGEGHGFRQAANIVRCLEAELSFYLQILDLPHPAELEPVELRRGDAP